MAEVKISCGVHDQDFSRKPEELTVYVSKDASRIETYCDVDVDQHPVVRPVNQRTADMLLATYGVNVIFVEPDPQITECEIDTFAAMLETTPAIMDAALRNNF